MQVWWGCLRANLALQPSANLALLYHHRETAWALNYLLIQRRPAAALLSDGSRLLPLCWRSKSVCSRPFAAWQMRFASDACLLAASALPCRRLASEGSERGFCCSVCHLSWRPGAHARAHALALAMQGAPPATECPRIQHSRGEGWVPARSLPRATGLILGSLLASAIPSSFAGTSSACFL